MNYLEFFLAKICDSSPVGTDKTDKTPGGTSIQADENFGYTHREELTKLTKLTKPTPEPAKPGFVSFVSTNPEENENLASIPDRSVWRSVVATWDIPRRQQWADRAEQYQVEGAPWNVAEWKAFNEVKDSGPEIPETKGPEPEVPDYWRIKVPKSRPSGTAQTIFNVFGATP
jgi:hypothetical protein